MISDKIIERLFSKWKRKLKMKQRIFWLDNLSVWQKIINQQTFKKRCTVLLGAVATGADEHFIYINKSAHKDDLKEIETTIIHELEHVKNPTFSESKIRRITNKLFPRGK